MDDEEYRLLQLDPGADRLAVESALERLSKQADALAYSSPERSQILKDRVRAIKEDLLRAHDETSRRQPSSASSTEVMRDAVVVGGAFAVGQLINDRWVKISSWEPTNWTPSDDLPQSLLQLRGLLSEIRTVTEAFASQEGRLNKEFESRLSSLGPNLDPGAALAFVQSKRSEVEDEVRRSRAHRLVETRRVADMPSNSGSSASEDIGAWASDVHTATLFVGRRLGSRFLALPGYWFLLLVLAPSLAFIGLALRGGWPHGLLAGLSALWGLIIVVLVVFRIRWLYEIEQAVTLIRTGEYRVGELRDDAVRESVARRSLEESRVRRLAELDDQREARFEALATRLAVISDCLDTVEDNRPDDVRGIRSRLITLGNLVFARRDVQLTIPALAAFPGPEPLVLQCQRGHRIEMLEILNTFLRRVIEGPSQTGVDILVSAEWLEYVDLVYPANEIRIHRLDQDRGAALERLHDNLVNVAANCIASHCSSAWRCETAVVRDRTQPSTVIFLGIPTATGESDEVRIDDIIRFGPRAGLGVGILTDPDDTGTWLTETLGDGAVVLSASADRTSLTYPGSPESTLNLSTPDIGAPVLHRLVAG